MREGKLLAESSPLQLLERFQCTSLEDAFLTVSQMQHNNMAITNISTIHRSNVEDSEEPEILCQNRHKQKKVHKQNLNTYVYLFGLEDDIS